MPGAAVASSTVVVKGSDVGTPPGQHWALTSQTGSYTTGFVTGPGTPPLGTGSLRLTVSGTASHIALYNYDDGLFFPAPDVKLADIDAIGYSTYRDGASVTPNIVPSYNIELRSVTDDETFTNPLLAFVMGERNTADSKRKSESVRGGQLRRVRDRGLPHGRSVWGYAPGWEARLLESLWVTPLAAVSGAMFGLLIGALVGVTADCWRWAREWFGA